MHQPSPVPATPFHERLRSGSGRRGVALGLAFLVEGLLLLAFLSLGMEKPPGTTTGKSITLLDIEAPPAPDEAPAPSEAEPAAQADPRPVPQQPAEQPLPPQSAAPLPPRPVETPPVPVAPPVLPSPQVRPRPAQPPPSTAPRAPARPVYGPPDTGGSPAFRDSERVGTAPNGEPLYAAAWYREPEAAMMKAYLSTATGPGWGLIACRTVPGYRVEDCVGLDEYPRGSQITRAALAAAWEFRVRPARLGGKSQVGSWVRIRIEYGRERR